MQSRLYLACVHAISPVSQVAAEQAKGVAERAAVAAAAAANAKAQALGLLGPLADVERQDDPSTIAKAVAFCEGTG